MKSLRTAQRIGLFVLMGTDEGRHGRFGGPPLKVNIISGFQRQQCAHFVIDLLCADWSRAAGTNLSKRWSAVVLLLIYIPGMIVFSGVLTRRMKIRDIITSAAMRIPGMLTGTGTDGRAGLKWKVVIGDPVTLSVFGAR